jgi:hypothetical protein
MDREAVWKIKSDEKTARCRGITVDRLITLTLLTHKSDELTKVLVVLVFVRRLLHSSNSVLSKRAVRQRTTDKTQSALDGFVFCPNYHSTNSLPAPLLTHP